MLIKEEEATQLGRWKFRLRRFIRRTSPRILRAFAYGPAAMPAAFKFRGRFKPKKGLRKALLTTALPAPYIHYKLGKRFLQRRRVGRKIKPIAYRKGKVTWKQVCKWDWELRAWGPPKRVLKCRKVPYVTRPKRPIIKPAVVRQPRVSPQLRWRRCAAPIMKRFRSNLARLLATTRGTVVRRCGRKPRGIPKSEVMVRSPFIWGGRLTRFTIA